MKNGYSISYPQTVCNGVRKPVTELILLDLSLFRVNKSSLSTISSTGYYAAKHNVFRHPVVFSTNPLCL